MGNKFNRGTAALLIVGTISLSGVTGFAGAYLANNLKTETAAPIAASKTSIETITLSNTKSASGDALSISEIASLNAESVVEITTETISTGSRMRQYVSEGAGSGVIISKDGYIVTNNHVIDGASKITVKTSDGKSYSATLVGKDSKTDLAVVKINGTDLKAVVFGDSSKLVVGELAVAIGNPLGELGGTATEGIISALNRDISIDGETMNLLQTSAAINPGNSGGGLFNEYGELIGIVNAKSSGSGIEGLGFAIPVSTVVDVVEDIIKYGYIKGRVDTGFTVIDISDTQTALMYRIQTKGLYIEKVTDSSSSLQSGDIIVSVDGTAVSNSSEFNQIIDKHKVGDAVTVVVNRGRSNIEVKLTLKQATS
jgi:serine protease Do